MKFFEPEFLKRASLIAILLCIPAGALTLYTNTEFLYIIIFCFCSLPTGITLNYFLEQYLQERAKRKKEDLIPDLLLQASAFPAGMPITKTIGFFSQTGFGKLGKEFQTALEEIEKGASIQKALYNIKKRCKSSIIDRTIELLVRGYESGADMSTVFRNTAEDFFATKNILRERNAALVVEKYTLLLAGGIIVPAVLGLLFGMVHGIDFTGLSELEIGATTAEQNSSLLQTIMLANQIYIAEYAILASIFLALQEGNTKKSFLYALFLLPVSFAVNAITKTIFI
ncbi:MAG: type II secretion system F family protein [Candidatus Diapherotrites archaeon]|nr:type II secretion system F family protein [Candidatus Diapherotrites archaeon]